MSTELKAHDMGRFQRLVLVEGPRVRGTFAVLLSPSDRDSWVKAHDVVIYDESHHSGMCFYSNDLTGSVKDGVASLSKHMVAPRLLADVEDVWSEMLEAMVAAVDAARAAAPVPDPKPSTPMPEGRRTQ